MSKVTAPQSDADEASLPQDSGHEAEEHAAIRKLPAMGIALVLHALGLFIAAFIISLPPEPPRLEPLVGMVEEPMLTEIPQREQQVEKEFHEDMPPVDTEVITPKITDKAVDERSEDPTEVKLNSLAPNPDPSDSLSESPNPNKGQVSTVGIGGGRPGGGGVPGGPGGLNGTRGNPPGGRPQSHRIDAALRWLADHQNLAGYWSAAHFARDSVRIKQRPDIAVTGTIDFLQGTPDTGWDDADVGVTGLALLAFAANAHTHTDFKSDYAFAIRQALAWLLSVQNPDGSWGPQAAGREDVLIYSHAICTMAIAEIYEMSGDIKLRSPAQRGIDFIVSAQNEGLGWRYGIKPGDNDSSVTAWMVLALKSGKSAGLNFPHHKVYADANAWYDEVTGKNTEGYQVTGYTYKASPNARLPEAEGTYERNPSMDACAAMVRLFTEHTKQTRELGTQVSRLLGSLPAWNPEDPKSLARIDMYYWYYATLALYQVGGSAWDTWEKALINPVVVKYQRGFHPKDVAQFGQRVTSTSKDDGGRWILDEHGSWDPVDAWGSAGGRVYATAMQAMTLGAYYRYNRILGK